MPSLLVCVLEESFTRLENTGHLTKHGGKFKTWRKRYFIPKKCALCYWNSQNDIYRKPSTPDPARQSLQYRARNRWRSQLPTAYAAEAPVVAALEEEHHQSSDESNYQDSLE